ncbi:hypothetical protein JG688_00010243 [Phytophthora aleatoria]|uniref:Uncharacterized protein n=1 Tax=Phytophthora aleatoria TaxID=2496075 RepID=A0A8J5IEU4_9STRA|nr:hypothetical protein JG688_00010243 [Phytophthora aleatoria]
MVMPLLPIRPEIQKLVVCILAVVRCAVVTKVTGLTGPPRKTPILRRSLYNPRIPKTRLKWTTYLPGTLPPSYGRSASSEKANVARAAGNSVAAARAPMTEDKFRAAERMGWRPPRPTGVSQSPRRDDSQNNSYCENCCVFGHYKANRWQG